jgi:tetratricopeptide (TPR) repeat protein
LKAAENVLDRDSVNFDALMQRATVRLLKDDIDGAILEFGRIARIYDRAPQAKFQLALAYLRKGDTARADEQLNLAVRLSPTFDEAIVALAELNVQKGNPGAAVSPLTQLLKRQPKAGPAAILLAKAYQALGRLEDALATLRQSAAAAPQSPEPPYLVGSILFQQNRIGEARTCFEESVRLAEDYWPAQEKLVDVDLLEKRSAAAMERTERMLQKYPKAAAPRLFRAKIRLSSGDTDGAEADLLTAIDLEPKSAYAYFQLSKVYFVANRTREAIEKMATLAAKTNSPGALMQLGMLQRAVAKFEESRGTYEKLLSADPKFFPALNNLAILHSENLGQLEKGFSLAKQARTIAPTDPVVADTLGWIYFRMGQYESALPLLLEASTKTIPPDPDVEYHLGMAHYFLAQEESAKKAFGRVVDQASNSPAKEDAVRRLAVLAIDAATADSSVRADLEQRAQKDGKDPVLLCRLAGMERRAGASAQAAEHYEAALKLSPRSPLIMEALVEIYLGPVPQPQRARELAKAAHEMAPNDAQISRYLGHLLYKAGEFAWSATLLGEAAGQLSTSSEVFHDLAFAYYNLGRLRDAEATVKKFLALDSPMAARQSCERLGKMIAASSSPGNAMAAKAEAVEILRTEPEYLPALAVSALALEQQGDYQSAAKAYEKILSKNPVFALAMRQLAILYAEHLGDDQKAEDMALAARKTYPDDVQLAHHFGVVEYRRGDYTAAARLLQQSTVARDANPEGVFLLGMSYYHLKNVMESRRALQRALELNLPEQEANEARRVIEALNQIERE